MTDTRIETVRFSEKIRNALRRRWLHYGLRNISNNDNHQGLERLYRLNDPWHLDSHREHIRFALTNREIAHAFGKVGKLLEIGSGEGYQSAYLRRLCDELWGVEISKTAVARAKTRLPDAKFFVGDVNSQLWSQEAKRFDLVVACEVLYYISDIKATLDTMNRLGKACFVSFFSPEAYKLTELIEAIPNVQKKWIAHDRTTWLLAYWTNE